MNFWKCRKEKGGGGAAEGGGVQPGNEREAAAVWEVGASVRVSIHILQCYLVSSEPHTEPCNVWQVGEWMTS